MVLVRLLSAAAELTGALLMLRLNALDAAVRINGILGLVGPLVLITATAIGVAGLADQLSPARILLVFAGVAAILYATR